MKLIDFKVYFKYLARNKLYTFVSIFGFSIALMFIIALSTYVKQQLSVDNFQEKKDRIFLMTREGKDGFGNTVAQYVKDNCPEVESYVRLHNRKVFIGHKGSEKVSAKVLFADSTFFNIFSFKLIDGNPSDILGAGKAVVTHSFANRIYPGQNPIGKSLIIDYKDHIITGIMEDIPENTMLPKTDAVVNYNSIVNYWGESVITTSDNFGFATFLLEKQGANIVSKTEILKELFKKDFWLYKNGFSNDLKLVPLKQAYFELKESIYGKLRSNNYTLIFIYIAIAAIILVIALFNYINLTVAQAGFRGKETAIKKLMGCNRSSLIIQLLGESLIITSFTFVIGLGLACISEPFFNNVLNTNLEILNQFDLYTITITIAFIITISLLAGVIPAIIISGFQPIEVIKGTFSRKVKSTYSKILIIFQYTVTIILLICSTFMQRQTSFLINYDRGFNTEGILEIDNGLNKNQVEGFKAIVYGIPGVELVSLSSGTPSNGGNNNSYEFEGEQFSFQEFWVDSTFFKIYGITIEPTGVTSDESYWVNRQAYNAIHPDKTTQSANMGYHKKVTIAGIINDINIQSLYNTTGLIRISKIKEEEYPWNIIVKISGSNPHKVADKIIEEYKKYSGGEIIEPKFVTEMFQIQYKDEQRMLSIMSAFTILTVIIMIVGVFAMSLYIIRQKEKEIGVRKVNGATVMEILVILNKDSLIRVLIAFCIACPISYYAINKWLESFAYKINLSWYIFVISGLVVLLMTLLSVSWVIWKAARANPVESLKGE